MFDVSFSELMVIGVIALIVIGPERLPKVARTIGHLMGRAQRYVNDVKSDIRREIELDELRQFKSEMEETANTMHSSLRETSGSLMKPLEDVRDELGKGVQDAAKAVSDARADVQKDLKDTAAEATLAHDDLPPAAPDPLQPSAKLPLPAAPEATPSAPADAPDAVPTPHKPTGTPS